MDKNIHWWQKAVFYQIYPRSFCDGNGDGIGDLSGMISRLDYLQDLGIDAIWLSPHFPSPFIDCGYDISDYENVAPEYGTLDQFREFLAGAHQRGIRLVLDLVLNHTSDKHSWFKESRSSKNNTKRDWYIWKKGINGRPPNNWYSAFGGSAWEFDATTGEYYYHYFFKEQPDLNWKNPEVQAAMFNIARFWLDMGVDGFRLDAVGTIFEDEKYTPLTLNMNQEQLFKLERMASTNEHHKQVMKYWMEMFHNQVDQPEVHQLMKDLRKVVDDYEDRVLIGETDDVHFYGNGKDELHLNFNFWLMRTQKITASHVRKNQQERLSALPPGAWPCNTLGNHDSARIYSNFGDGVNNLIQAKLHLILLLTLKGTPFLYNGEEIGMSDFMIDDPNLFRDPLGNLYYELEKRVMGANEEQATREGAKRGRDRNRTPMQWSSGANAGFCPPGTKPWLPVNPDHSRGINLAQQLDNPDSIFSFYRKLLRFRLENPALQLGEYAEVTSGNEEVLSYTRTGEKLEFVIILNLSDHEQKAQIESLSKFKVTSINTHADLVRNDMEFILQPYQGLILSTM